MADVAAETGDATLGAVALHGGGGGSGSGGKAVKLRAIPYFLWDNRRPGTMAVWLGRGN